MENNNDNQAPIENAPIQQSEPVVQSEPTASPEPVAPPEPTIPPEPITSPEPTTPANPINPTPAAFSNTSESNTIAPSTKSQFSVSIKSIILTATNALGALCFFLPWVTVTIYSESRSANATEIGNDYRYMGYFILILLVISSTIAAMKIANKLSLVPKICLSAISGLAALLSIIMIIIIFNDLHGYGSAGIGLWICAIAGIASAALPWIPIKGE